MGLAIQVIQTSSAIFRDDVCHSAPCGLGLAFSLFMSGVATARSILNAMIGSRQLSIFILRKQSWNFATIIGLNEVSPGFHVGLLHFAVLTTGFSSTSSLPRAKRASLRKTDSSVDKLLKKSRCPTTLNMRRARVKATQSRFALSLNPTELVRTVDTTTISPSWPWKLSTVLTSQFWSLAFFSAFLIRSTCAL